MITISTRQTSHHRPTELRTELRNSEEILGKIEMANIITLLFPVIIYLQLSNYIVQTHTNYE